MRRHERISDVHIRIHRIQSVVVGNKFYCLCRTETMNWMTSAKKRISKVSKRRPESFKRLNAFKKLNTANRKDILRLPTRNANERLKINKETYDCRMMASIDQSEEEPLPSVKQPPSKDPFAELNLSSEDEDITFLNAQHSSSKTEEPQSNFRGAFSNDNRFQVELAVTTNLNIPSISSPSVSRSRIPDQRDKTVEPKEQGAYELAEIWDLFDGDSRGWEKSVERHKARNRSSVVPPHTLDNSARNNQPSNINKSNILSSPAKQCSVCVTTNADELDISDFH